MRLTIELKNPKPADMVLMTNLLFANQSATWNALLVANLENKRIRYEIDRIECVKLSHAISMDKIEEACDPTELR